MSEDKELQMLEEIDNNQIAKEYLKDDIDDLIQRNKSFLKKCALQKNQVVKWKHGLKNRRFPLENQPAIIVDILNPILISEEKETGSPYFREPLDILLGFIDEKRGDFLVFHCDSRRFEPYETND